MFEHQSRLELSQIMVSNADPRVKASQCLVIAARAAKLSAQMRDATQALDHRGKRKEAGEYVATADRLDSLAQDARAQAQAYSAPVMIGPSFGYKPRFEAYPAWDRPLEGRAWRPSEDTQ